MVCRPKSSNYENRVLAGIETWCRLLSMRDGFLTLMIVAMLFVSMEGMAESVDDASFHQTHHGHSDNVDNQWFPDSDSSDHDGDPCEHFCHAHVVALTARISVPSLPKFRQVVPEISAHAISRGAAPPIPPPNI